MSSYRSYAPWKSSLPASYKSGSASAYSSRDDVSSNRYGSLASPSTYRPSFSGGTYRIKRDPPPTVTPYVSRYASVGTPKNDKSRDSSATKLDTASKYASGSSINKESSPTKRYTTSNSNLSKYGRSREPSPATLERTNRIKSREPSPPARALRGKSRDPSPAIDTKCKLSYSGVNSYRMSSTPRASSSGYSSRYGSIASVSRPSASTMPDKSISYLSVSDFRARSISRAREVSSRKSNEKELEDTNSKVAEHSELVTETAALEIKENEPDSATEGEETFVAVPVVTRATSPTPPGSTTVQRTRRIDIAKTIEKTIQRSTRKKEMLEKEIQSDRMDDPTRYSRFGLGSCVSTYSPHREGRYSSSNSLRYSNSPLSTTSKSTSSHSEAKKDDTTKRVATPDTKATKSKLSPPKAVRINSRQSSVENLAANNAIKALPPTAPKAESPTKNPVSGANATVKWPNKDFRKSALNVGPTDRPRKSRTPSTGTESDGTTPLRQRQERSPSACSEVSNTSAGTSKRCVESKLRQRCHPKAGATAALSRQNSSTQIKSNAHKSCHPATSAYNTSSSTSACSSSGAESGNENSKNNKQKKGISRKKSLNCQNKETTDNGNEPKRTHAGDVGNVSSASTTIAKISIDSQPPAACAAELVTTAIVADVDYTPSTLNKNTEVDRAFRADSSKPTSLTETPEKATCRQQKLSTVSNFFAARQNDTNSEPIFIESSESSTELDTNLINNASLTEDFKTKTSPAHKATINERYATTTTTAPPKISHTDPDSSDTATAIANKELQTLRLSTEESSEGSVHCTSLSETKTPSSNTSTKSKTKSKSKSKSKSATPSINSENSASSTQLPTTELQTETGTSFTTSTEQEEPSWWQDTSNQINTASALDVNPKDEMRYRLRHIDSGEVAWWLRNDDEDTLANDDIKTLNQEEEDASIATGRAHSLPTTQLSGYSNGDADSGAENTKNSWWTSEINDENDNEHNNEDEVETHISKNKRDETDYKRESSSLESQSSSAVSNKEQSNERGQSSPETRWWYESKDNAKPPDPEITNANCTAKQNGSIQLKICRVESGERPWWLEEENQATVEATIKLPLKDKSKVLTANGQQLDRSSSSSNNLSGETHWWMSGPTKKLFNVRRIESGEKAWWQQDDESEAQKTKTSPVQQRVLETSAVRRSNSGEQAWWLQDNVADNDTAQQQANGYYASTPLNMHEAEHEQQSEQDEEDAENGDEEVQQIINYNNNQSNANRQFGNYSNSNSNAHLNDALNYEYVERPPPLGHRASPDGLEDPLRQRKSPYDNIPMSKVHSHQTQHDHDHHHLKQTHQQSHQTSSARQAHEKLFISRHKNIDELLGGACRPLSPLFFDGNSFLADTGTAAAGRNLFLEEITPDQVRIHDSTAQMPIIQRMERDDWDYKTNTASTAAKFTPAFEQRTLDDAAIQVYKDGDYGAYLDLESSLAEQAEEIEGLNASRKNSLVVRTQLSVRVHAIIEKLLSSEGSDLRRALFSLKQVFQEDKDLVHAFVALGGLNCLVRVGNGADQNYQNYILRALGQVMLYVDGMNGVMKHEPTMQWLYSLIASKYRSVVKTALKLLLVFVEYVETNCYLLVNAIHVVDKAQGTLPWSNIMRLLKDYDNADAELVIYATSLINKTLAGLTDQDSFYDESDLLEQQGMESVISRYMSKPGTDIDLLDQLQLYEAVLKFEDGEADGIRLPNNSVRKTQRYRQNGNDTVERRKSRRHSTGASPAAAVMNKVIPSPKRGTPMYGVLDEDSSGSANSNEYSNGVLQEQKTNHESMGVTPGLRRRRERAERHKSFLKEQQEAAANGFFTNFEKRDDMVGQLVTAIPATVKNGGTDSPPASLLTLANEANLQHNNNMLGTPTATPQTPSSNTTNNINSNNLLGTTTKPLLHGSNTISIINNSFDKSHHNNSNIKLLGTPEFLTKKNLLMEHNATVINGIRKNIQRGHDSECAALNSSTNNNNHSSNIAYKKYESDANRLNSYYSQLSSPKNNQNMQSAHEALAAVLSPKKTLNGFDFTQTTTTPLSPKRNIQSNPQSPIKSFASTAETPLSSPVSPVLDDEVFEPWVVAKKLEPMLSCSAQAAAPPPPPPPPPDLLGLPYGRYLGRASEQQSPATPLEDSTLADVGLLQITETEHENEDKKMLLQLQRDHTVKDLTQKLSNIPTSPTHADLLQNRIVGDMSGLISKAKEGLAKSKSKGEISRSSSVDQEIKKPEPKKSENELQWEELVRSMMRPLNLCDLDFTDLNSDDEKDVLAPRGLGGGIPPPPPPCGGPPPMMPSHIVCPPPMMSHMSNMLPPPMFSYSNQGPSSLTNSLNSSINGDIGSTATIKKNKKTVKLFWKEVREDMIPVTVGKTIWDELPASNVDTQKLEHLFESRAKDLITKKQQELNKSKEVIVLDHKRSNAINIAMTKLPPPRAIKAAILKMDATVVTREGIDKLLNMLPTDEERGKIQEAQMANPELPLGSAEQFLLTLASISELAARLKLWAFRLDFDNSEKEIAEPLMDLKQGIQILRNNRTFRCILSTLLSVGIFLNGAPVKGFQIEYLAKVPEVKDTVHKHSLLHHLCHMVMESSSETTDLYSEIGPITRASKADFADLAHNLNQLETECKSSWDRLKLIAKHDCAPQLKQKLVDFLADCAERIIILQIVHRRVINRYRKFLLWLGVPQHSVAESKPNEFCRILSEFALEYRTTRERVQQQIEKKANHRERNKTRGKMIIDIGKFKTKEDRADAELKELLGTPSPGTVDGTLTWRRRRAEQLRSPISRQSEENFTDGDDEILESLVKTATKAPGTRTTPRERKRTRHADRKSLRRTLKNGLTEEEKQHVAALINTY